MVEVAWRGGDRAGGTEGMRHPREESGKGGIHREKAVQGNHGTHRRRSINACALPQWRTQRPQGGRSWQSERGREKSKRR